LVDDIIALYIIQITMFLTWERCSTLVDQGP